MTACLFVAAFFALVAWPAPVERLLAWSERRRQRRRQVRDQVTARVTYLPSAVCRSLGELAGRCDYDTCAICKTKTPPSGKLASGVSEAGAGGGGGDASASHNPVEGGAIP